MKKKYYYLMSVYLIFVILGCTNKNLYFGTHTQIGLDVSGTATVPNDVAFAFGRTEVVIEPKKSDSIPHSVYGGLDSDITWFSGQMIRQLFATGCAAQYIGNLSDIHNPAGNNDNNGSNDEPKPKNEFQCKDKVDPADRVYNYPNTNSSPNSSSLILIVKSKFGLDINFGQENVTPELVLGYKRSELTIIPIDNPHREVASVYADISINSYLDPNAKQLSSAIPTPASPPATTPTAGDTSNKTETNPDPGDANNDEPLPTPPPSRIGGVRIVQQIATGHAAIALVKKNTAIQKKLIKALGGGAPTTKSTLTRAQIRAKIIEQTEKLNTDAKKNELFDWVQENYTYQFTGAIDKLKQFKFIFLKKPALNEEQLNLILKEVIRINNENGGNS